MRIFVAALIVLPVVLGDVCALSAQTLPEPRVIGGVFGGRRPPDPANPDRSSHQVTFGFDLSGGYDKNVGIDENTFIGSDVQQGGSIGASSMAFQHRWGTSRNYLDTTAHGNLRVASAGVEQQVSARSQIQGAATFGRRAGMLMTVSGAYEPAYLFNAFGPLAASVADGIVAGADVAEGFTEQRWLRSTAAAGVHRKWTPRQRTDVDYATSHREPVTGSGFNSYSQSAQLRHDWSYRERSALALKYRFEENRQEGGFETLHPLRLHHADMRMRLERRLDRNRSLGVSFGAGATYARPQQAETGLTEQFIVPAGSGGFYVRMSDDWTFSIDANRNVAVLEGLNPDPFTTDAVALAATGRFGRRVELTGNAAYSRGNATTTDQGAFETTVGTVQLRYALAVCCALTTTYAYYGHQLFDIATLTPGFPSRHRRNSIRLGMSFWVPLFGSFRTE